MKKVFWDNSYQQELKTVVASVNGNEILFDETVIFSFCGGQESDKASVDRYPSFGFSYGRQPDLLYVPRRACGFKPGDIATQHVNLPSRNHLMGLLLKLFQAKKSLFIGVNSCF